MAASENQDVPRENTFSPSTAFEIIREINLMFCHGKVQKHPSRDVFWKRCSENMHQIYKRTPMPKCDFNKVAY